LPPIKVRIAGVITPPTLEGRTGRYGDEHLLRLVMIGRLQRRGWSLAAIRDALVALGAGRSLAELLGLSAEPGRDWVDELFDDQHPAAGPDAFLPHGMWN